MSEEKKAEAEAEGLPFIGNPYKETTKDIDLKANEDKSVRNITCGFWIFKGTFLQKLATEKMFVVIYGIGGAILSMALAYFNATVTTLEKRYRISSKNTGVIIVGHDIALMITSVLAGYYIRRVHRPRWLGFGFFTVFLFAVLMFFLQVLYGSGEDALKLTHEYGGYENIGEFFESSKAKQKLCLSEPEECLKVGKKEESIWIPMIIMFLGQTTVGVGVGLFWIVGVAYMDDNTSKSKSPAMISIASFIRLIGPALGYTLASMCLRRYIEPSLTPLIVPGDTRWLGCWWIGWLILAVISITIAFLMFLFPKELPSSQARRLKLEKAGLQDSVERTSLTLSNMWQAIKRLTSNKIFVYNNISANFYFFGYLAYWVYTPKYIEIVYRQSAAIASMATGSIALAFTAAGVLLSGYVVSKYKPSGRAMAAWNATVDFLTVAGILTYVFIGCDDSDRLGSMVTTSDSCSAACHCDYVHYDPICSFENITYISACHAGCTGQSKDAVGRTVFTGCECISATNMTNVANSTFPSAVNGACPVDCTNQFYIFLSVMCILKLVGSSSKATSLLIGLRCIKPEDKSFALGFGAMLGALTAFVPSPVFFGWLLDRYCLVWSKTCSNKGNCWVYDTKSLRYAFNYTSALVICLGGIFNIAVWYHAKELKIYDDKDLKSKIPDSKELQLTINTKESKQPEKV